MNSERMPNRSSLASIMRHKLGDITNSQSQHKFANQGEKSQQATLNQEQHQNQLLKENTALLKIIEERTKIIELSGIELRNLGINFQKLQLQNWNLARSNSQMLAELNMGRERLKRLQHEIVCKDALLQSKNLEIKALEQTTKEPLRKAVDSSKPCNRTRRCNARSHSMGSSSTTIQETEKGESKRHCLRRRSGRFNKSQEFDNLFEIDDVKDSLEDHHHHSTKDEAGQTQMLDSRTETNIITSRRSSTGRLMRSAVGKIHSYKEVPLNVKLRRDV